MAFSVNVVSVLNMHGQFGKAGCFDKYKEGSHQSLTQEESARNGRRRTATHVFQFTQRRYFFGYFVCVVTCKERKKNQKVLVWFMHTWNPDGFD